MVADAGCVAQTLPSDDVRGQDAAAYGNLTYGDRAHSNQGDDGTTSPRRRLAEVVAATGVMRPSARAETRCDPALHAEIGDFVAPTEP